MLTAYLLTFAAKTTDETGSKQNAPNGQEVNKLTEQPSTLSSRNARLFCNSSSTNDLSVSSGVSTDRHTDRQIDTHAQRQTDRQRDREREREYYPKYLDVIS